ncbi:AAA family ATPase [Bifidobacterium sp. 82T24]|uniref:AAA family ATPase n=1 Tax=Bifidobacterium pluvialisilvae TaxID=2834436 RepID=UPI001C5A22C5|nr:AAA family ATPase [Bifidobacterium pluvialisilvae]MBW3087220.1 AAA family ATPase [Bifidobacterium pluvialisilvae]
MMTMENANSVLNSYHRKMMAPVLEALRELGGSAARPQVHDQIAKDLLISEQDNQFKKAVDFARLTLVFGGYIEPADTRGVWTLTDSGKTVDMTAELASDIIRRRNRYDREQRGKKKTVDNALGDSGVPEKKYWSYRPGVKAENWHECLQTSLMLIGYGGIGDVAKYDSRNDIQQALQNDYGFSNAPRNVARELWQFVYDMNPGDVIVAVDGHRGILGIGKVQSGYEYQTNDTSDFNHVRQVVWTDLSDDHIVMESEKQFHNMTLNEITGNLDMVRQIDEIIDDGALDIDGASTDDEHTLEPYSREKFLDEVYVSERTYDNLVAALDRKKNIILMGAPGVGKTFMAKRLAYSIMGEKDSKRVTMVQFHQNYSYEDFMLGYRPTDNGFALKYGVFYEFCKKAEADEDRPYYFIIDEINRGNLSKIFGELFMLIENDKRGLSLRLPYADELFSIPKNVFIIGMMNTADRSLAMIDYALRRRFAFIELEPGFDTDGFNSYMHALQSEKFNRLITAVKELNREIARDDSLGKGFRIGHSYFCGLDSKTANEQTLSGIVEYELIPLLEEYWFDEPQKVDEEADKLRKAIR